MKERERVKEKEGGYSAPYWRKLLAGKYTAALLGSSDYRKSGFETRVTAKADPRENSVAKLLPGSRFGHCREPAGCNSRFPRKSPAFPIEKL